MRPGAARVTRFAISPMGAAALAVDRQSRDLTITPDGTHIVYKGSGWNQTDTQFFVAPLDQLEPTPLAGLGRQPRAPFSSPDGRWIGFVEPVPVTLKKVAITGGPALALCRLDGASRGATWGDDDSIIFATAAPSTGLQRVSSAGGEPTVLTKPNRERGESDHLWPQFLPGSQGRSVYDHPDDGRHRCLAGGRPRPVDRHTEDPDAGRQPGAIRVERPSDLRRGGYAPRRRL